MSGCPWSGFDLEARQHRAKEQCIGRAHGINEGVHELRPLAAFVTPTESTEWMKKELNNKHSGFQVF